MGIRLQLQDDVVDLMINRNVLVNVLVEKTSRHFGNPRNKVKLVRNGRPLQPSLTIAQDGLDDWTLL